MHDPIKVLWLSVMMVGLDNAGKSQKAEAWIWSPNFDDVCEFADTAAESVRREFYRQADSEHPDLLGPIGKFVSFQSM